MLTRRRIVMAVMAGILAAFGVSGCSTYEKARRMQDDLKNPDDSSAPLSDEQKVKLVDGLRPRGSFEAAGEQLTHTAQSIAEQISAAVPGQTWKFDNDQYAQEDYSNGLSCNQLTGDIARRPIARPLSFDSTFSAEAFTTAAKIVRQEAAKYGATTETSLFNESSKRDYDVQGNGYEFKVGQITFATLSIKGDCLLLQKIIDMPPGQLPPEPPIVPTTP
jgi:hypothetical protein